MLSLQPMTEDEFVAYKSWLLEDYASDLAKNYRMPIEEARASAIKETDATLPQGLATPNHFLYDAVTTSGAVCDGESRLGYLWIHVDGQRQRCFIYDIYLRAEFRHQGWGRKILQLLECNMKQQGIIRINLNVFANNSIAREFYSKMGYAVTDMHMSRWLTDSN
jgi:ribosomal protein S18 acetylase RimI-like enzyme